MITINSIKEKIATKATQLFRLRTAYKNIFNIENRFAQIVLADLRKECPIDPTHNLARPFDEKQLYINIGRRQIFSRILSMLNTSDATIRTLLEREMEEDKNGRRNSGEW